MQEETVRPWLVTSQARRVQICASNPMHLWGIKGTTQYQGRTVRFLRNKGLEVSRGSDADYAGS